MIQSIIGTKQRQSRMFTSDGVSIPVTYVQVEPQMIVQVKTKGQDGYDAVQIGIGVRKPSRVSKQLAGHMKKSGEEGRLFRYLREVTVDGDTPTVGTSVSVGDVLQVGDSVHVTGTSKGKGFAGVVKRHGFRGGPRTHGQSDRERAPGSLGQTTTPGRVYRGKRMAGRMGQDRVTIKNLKVISLDVEKQELIISGVVPGSKNSLVMIQKQHA